MGMVYLTRHERWQIDLALKVPHPELLADAEHSHRVVAEAEAWTALGMHPHIAYCFYVHPFQGVPLLVVEYVDGGNLRDAIQKGYGADVRRGLDLAIQLCHGLEHSHKHGLIHRDLKPENVLLASDGTLKITDFGIARVKSSAASTPEEANRLVQETRRAPLTVGPLGTYEYMPPEQWADAHRADERSDIFSLGVCLYELFCGRRPYLPHAVGVAQTAPDPRVLRGGDGLPDALCTLLQECVAWEPNDRPSDANAVRQELASIYRASFRDTSVWAELPDVSPEADGWNNRGVTYLELGQKEKAAECFINALRSDPHHLEASYNQGLLDWRGGRIDDAEVLRRLFRLPGSEDTPTTVSRAVARARIHQERFDPDSADAEMEAHQVGRERGSAWRPASSIALLRRWKGHDRSASSLAVVSSLAATPDGRSLLSGGSDGVRLWNGETGACVATLQGLDDDITAVAISHDGKVGFSGTRNGQLRVWDLQGQTCLHNLKTPSPNKGVDSLCLSPDGGMGLSGHGFSLVLWDLRTGQYRFNVDPQEGMHDGVCYPVTTICMSPDARLAVSGGAGKRINLWDLAAGSRMKRLDGHDLGLISAALDWKHKLLLTGSADQTLRLWDIDRAVCLRILSGHTGTVESVAIADEVPLAASGSADGMVKLWDLESGRCIRTLKSHPGVNSVALRSDGRRAWSAGWDGSICAWDIERSRPVAAPFQLSLPRTFAAISAAQQRRRFGIAEVRRLIEAGQMDAAFATVRALCEKLELRSDDEIASLYRTLTRMGRKKRFFAAVPRSVRAHTRECWVVALSGNGTRAMSTADNEPVRVWDVERLEQVGKDLRRAPVEGGMFPFRPQVAISADGRRALIGGGSPLMATLRCCDIDSGRVVELPHSECEHVRSIAIDDAGHRAVSADAHGFKFWDLENHELLVESRALQFTERFQNLTVVKLVRGGEILIAGEFHGGLKAWNTLSRELLFRLANDCCRDFSWNNYHAFAVDEMGNRALTVALDEDGSVNARVIRVWELPGGESYRSLEGHSDSVTSVALSRDGAYAVSGSFDGTLCLWDVEAGQSLCSLPVGARVLSVAMTPDASLAISGQEDGSIIRWRFLWDLEF
jgi:WD40 repeat protein/serine/threonine protein kinase